MAAGADSEAGSGRDPTIGRARSERGRADALEARGYRWVRLEEALADPVHARPISGFAGAGGITWLHRWAITEGLDRSIFAGGPEVPEWVARLQ